MKNENRVNFTVRLNLNNDRHRLAWEKLRSSSGSYTASIVDALMKEANPSVVLPDVEELKAVLRQAFLEAMRELPITMQPFIASEEIGGDREIDDLDFEIADDFMSALGC